MRYLSRTHCTKAIVLVSLSVLLSACSGDDSDSDPQAQNTLGPGGEGTLSSIAVTPRNLHITADQTMQFSAVGIYSDRPSEQLTKSVTWSSSNESVASVSDTGLVTAHSAGTSIITATMDTISGSTLLTVIRPESPDSGPDSEPEPDPEPDVPPAASAVVVDHTSTDLIAVPDEWIEKAEESLCIAYGHTSHGSQIISGMSGLVDFMQTDLYAFNSSGAGGALQLRDNPFTGAEDLGSPDRTAWAEATRVYLDAHPEVNVVMWSWCGQVSDAAEADIDTYLNLMSALEDEYPDVRFVYMTGHLDGTGLEGNLHQRNEQIRRYCTNNGKILYDFADIETYDPDGVYYGDKDPDDACSYDSDGDGIRDSNWAVQWQDSHIQGRDWYDCYSAHSQPLNANLKAYAAWWLWARLAGWDGR